MKTNNIELNGQSYDIESVEVRDNEIVLKRKQPKFKAGDVCVNGNESIFIYKEPHSRGIICHFAWLGFCNGLNGVIIVNQLAGAEGIRHATESERQQLFDELRKQKNLKWNPETKQLEPIRWRAEKGNSYYVATAKCSVGSYSEIGDNFDKGCYNLGNYFRTREQAERCIPYIKKAFADFWADELKNEKPC